MMEAKHVSPTTPVQINILFDMTELRQRTSANSETKTYLIKLNDADLIAANENLLPYGLRSKIDDEHDKVEHQSVGMKILESGYRFGLGKKDRSRVRDFVHCRRLIHVGSIAGAVGATAVYPIDLGKHLDWHRLQS